MRVKLYWKINSKLKKGSVNVIDYFANNFPKQYQETLSL